MKVRSLLAILLAFALLLPLLASCNLLGGSGDNTGTTTAPPVTTAPSPGPSDPPAPVLDLLPIAELEGYTIVYPETAGDDLRAAVAALAEAIAEATGITLPVASDLVAVGETVPTDTKEILVGATNRYESSGAVNLRYHDFFVDFENGRLALIAKSESAAVEACDFLAEYLLKNSALHYPDGGYHHAKIYPLESLTLLGRPISDFVIVRAADSAAEALYLAERIAALTGDYLTIRTADSSEVAYEILVGNTGRTATEALPQGEKFVVDIAGTKVALFGNGDYASYRATLLFAEKYLDGKTSLITAAHLEERNSAMNLYTLNLPTELEALSITLPENAGGVFERFELTRDALPTEVTSVKPVQLSDYPLAAQNGEIFVSPEGDDEGAGTLEDPVETLAEAIRRMGSGGGVIWMRGGLYEIENVIRLNSATGGTRTSPLFIKAYGNETPVLTTYKRIETSWFDYVDMNDPMLNRFDPNVNTMEILVAPLAEYGFTKEDITELVSTANAYGDNHLQTRYGVTPALLIGGEEYNLARYPNEGEELLSFAYAYESGRVTSSDASVIYMTWLDRVASGGTYQGKPIDKNTPIPWEIALGEQATKDIWTKHYSEGPNWERYAPILNWVDTGNIWFCGRTYADWQVDHFNVHVGRKENGDYVSYQNNPNHPSIQSTMPANLGARTAATATYAHHFYLYNAIEALDIPGEWFIDVENPDLPLYIYPDDNFYSQEDISYTGNYNGNIFELNNASNIVFDGLTFEGVGKSAFFTNSSMGELSNILIQNCNFSNTGSWAISMTGTKLDHIGVIYSTFRRGHDGMLQINNAASTSLVPDHNVIQNNHFSDTVPNKHIGINAGGCMSVVSHNYLHNTVIDIKEPCYESIIEYNRLDGGSEDVGDGGQIYMYGLYTRGNHIRYNVCHGLSYSGNNIYNDGMCSGNYAYYNILSSINGWRSSQQKCFYVSTGHNNVAYNNIMISRTPERKTLNLEVRGIDIGTASLEAVPTPNGIVKRNTSDSLIHESTLFYCDERDPGYSSNPNGTGSDEAWYSWDMLYRSAAERFTGVRTYKYYDAEKWEERFPNFMDSMRGALAMFQKMDELGDDYDRRTAVVALDTLYNQTVTEMMAAGATKAEAEAEAFRLGYGYTEDFFRQPAYNHYENNLMLGGDAEWFFDLDGDGIFGEDRNDFVYSDYVNARGAIDDDGNKLANTANPFAKDLRIIEKNFYHPDMNEILAYPDPCEGSYPDPESLSYADYSINVAWLPDIMAAMPDFVEFQGLAWGAWQ